MGASSSFVISVLCFYCLEPAGCAPAGGHFFLLAQEKVTKKKCLKLFDLSGATATAVTPSSLGRQFGQRAPRLPVHHLLRGLAGRDPAEVRRTTSAPRPCRDKALLAFTLPAAGLVQASSVKFGCTGVFGAVRPVVEKQPPVELLGQVEDAAAPWASRHRSRRRGFFRMDQVLTPTVARPR